MVQPQWPHFIPVRGPFFAPGLTEFHRQSLRNLSPLSPRLVDQVPLQGSTGRYPPSSTGHLSPELPGKRCRCHTWRAVIGPCPYVRAGSIQTGGERLGKADERAVVPKSPTRVPTAQETILGQEVLGPRVLLDDQRRHHRRHRTSVPRTAHRKSHRRKPVGGLIDLQTSDCLPLVLVPTDAHSKRKTFKLLKIEVVQTDKGRVISQEENRKFIVCFGHAIKPKSRHVYQRREAVPIGTTI